MNVFSVNLKKLNLNVEAFFFLETLIPCSVLYFTLPHGMDNSDSEDGGRGATQAIKLPEMKNMYNNTAKILFCWTAGTSIYGLKNNSVDSE